MSAEHIQLACQNAQIALFKKTLARLRPSLLSGWSHVFLASHQLLVLLFVLIQAIGKYEINCQQAGIAFPGVSRDLASFCSARPSLSIDLAPMLIHVKKNTSFNYKLYLFSNDEHVFQTGQIVPRGDFRIHSFPVKLKSLNEFMPIHNHGHQSALLDQQQPLVMEVYQLVQARTKNQSVGGDGGPLSLVRVPTVSFNAKRFFAQVPLVPDRRFRNHRHSHTSTNRAQKRPRAVSVNRTANSTATTTSTIERPAISRLPFDVQGDVLPGDDSFGHHDVGLMPDAMARSVSSNANEHIEFDRDDQVAILSQTANRLRQLTRRQLNPSLTDHQQNSETSRSSSHSQNNLNQALVMPVGSFSSFRVNLTYLARKDFDQAQPELIRLRVDARRFQVGRVDILWPLTVIDDIKNGTTSTSDASDYQLDKPEPDDYAFLSHKLLRDQNTRITSISQIYEDWITRNFYTIVYIQRRLNEADKDQDGLSAGDEIDHGDAAEPENARRKPSVSKPVHVHDAHELVTDRLVFRGSSIVLLGADQLNYHVKASAFITEKNGLHYYLEFLSNGKFYLGAIDWTKRPFKFIDSQHFPIKPTRTQFDNEELLLCPPSVCYSDQPIDELVSYGRLTLSDELQKEASILAKSSSSSSSDGQIVESWKQDRQMLTLFRPKPIGEQPAERMLATRSLDDSKQLDINDQKHHPLIMAKSDGQQAETMPTAGTISHQSEPISLDNLVEAMKLGSSRLDVRLHLRDWAWQLPRIHESNLNSTITSGNNNNQSNNKFNWHYEWARRNEIKVVPDTYGFALVGHEIDASYRVYNELYLISANQLISINYTLANETVTSVHPIEDEFAGLGSSLLDPITGAFYDRYSNQIYFFKGDRYAGYDYATKKPLEDFLLPPAIDESISLMVQWPNQRQTTSGSMLSPTTRPTTTAIKLDEAKQRHRPLVSSLPVVGILGKQHHVDAIYHDLHEDIVYVFTGMKFYTHRASDFKDGAFRRASNIENSMSEPPMHCINERFLAGCRFDAAFPNPCNSDSRLETPDGGNLSLDRHQEHESANMVESEAADDGAKSGTNKSTKTTTNNFSEQQQMKLRSIAARAGLLDLLLDNTLVAQGTTRAFEPFLGSGAGPDSRSKDGLDSKTSNQEQIVTYLLIAMVLVTVLVTIAMIVVVLDWARVTTTDNQRYHHQVSPQNKAPEGSNQHTTSFDAGQLLAERVAYPPAISHYLASQYKQHQSRERLPFRHDYGPQTAASGMRLSENRIPPPPEQRRPYRERASRELVAEKSQSNFGRLDLNLVDSSTF